MMERFAINYLRIKSSIKGFDKVLNKPLKMLYYFMCSYAIILFCKHKNILSWYQGEELIYNIGKQLNIAAPANF